MADASPASESLPAPADHAKAKRTRKKMFLILFLVVAIAGCLFAAYWYLHARYYVSTDNAYVAAEIAQVAAPVAGRIKSIAVNDTQQVKAGDVIVVIDDNDAHLTLAQAEANLAQTETTRERTRLDLHRRETLVKSGSVSDEVYTTSVNAFKAAEAAVEANKALVKQAELDLERTTIVAPVNGIVSKRMVQLGQYVPVGTQLLSIVPLDKVHVDANFKEVQLRQVEIGDPVELTSDLYGKKIIYKGTVAGFSGMTGAASAVIPAQNATGNWIKVVQRLPVRIELDAEELAKNPLRVGLSMEATIDISARFKE